MDEKARKTGPVIKGLKPRRAAYLPAVAVRRWSRLVHRAVGQRTCHKPYLVRDGLNLGNAWTEST
jgi:hypothetical protein